MSKKLEKLFSKGSMADKKSQYLEKLRDPRWQKLRLEIFERDQWTCQSCYDTDSTLHVHHKYYIFDNRDPWDYPPSLLITLCEACHEEEKEAMAEVEHDIIRMLKIKFLAGPLRDLAQGIHAMNLQHAPEVVASAYSYAFSDPEVQKELIERYFESIKKKD